MAGLELKSMCYLRYEVVETDVGEYKLKLLVLLSACSASSALPRTCCLFLHSGMFACIGKTG